MSANSEYFQNILNTRLTIHDFKPEPVPKNVIDEALKSFMATPNHFLTKPWSIYVLGSKVKDKIIDLNTTTVLLEKGEKAAQIKKTRWSTVPCWVLVNCVLSSDKIRFQEDYAACACGIQNMMLSLWSNGYGSKWTTGPVTRHKEFSRIVGFDLEREVVVGLLWCGLPNTMPKRKKRDCDTNVTWLS